MSSITASFAFPRATAERSEANPWIIAITVTLATSSERLWSMVTRKIKSASSGCRALSQDVTGMILVGSFDSLQFVLAARDLSRAELTMHTWRVVRSD
jgi:hypothetical protein